MPSNGAFAFRAEHAPTDPHLITPTRAGCRTEPAGGTYLETPVAAVAPIMLRTLRAAHRIRREGRPDHQRPSPRPHSESGVVLRGHQPSCRVTTNKLPADAAAACPS